MFNIIESDGLKVWFTSDLHLGHQRDFIWEARGYNSPEHHTNSIIDTINEHVREGDILFNLGDLCLNTQQPQLDDYLDRIVCKNMWCLWGNHNNPHEKTVYRPGRNRLCPSREVNWVYPVKYKNMSYIGHYHEVAVNGQFIVMCHYPFMSWNKLSDGAWCLCGHEHGGLPATRPEATDGKILDLGWDLYHRPLSFDDLRGYMSKKNMCSVGHHVVQGQPPVLGAGAAGTRPA